MDQINRKSEDQKNGHKTENTKNRRSNIVPNIRSKLDLCFFNFDMLIVNSVGHICETQRRVKFIKIKLCASAPKHLC